MENLILHKREKKIRHQAKKERKQGLVPGVMYGKNIGNFMFETSELELNREVSINGEHGVINIDFDGYAHKALIKDVQRDPVKHQIIHIDLEDVPDNEIIQTNIPILFMGENSVTSRGGIIQKEKTTVKVQCMGSEIPKHIDVDLSHLNVGDSFRIANIEMSGDISFIDDASTIIAAITNKNKEVQQETMEATE